MLKIKIKISNKIIIILSILIIFVGVSLIGWNYFLSKKDKVYEEMSYQFSQISVIINPAKEMDDSILSDSEEILDSIDDPIEEEPLIPQQPVINYNYIGYLDIPKINLKKGFVSINSSDNNVNKNVAIMEDSSYPDVENGLFILAAHNGTCWNCYFKNLNKLKIGDSIYINYNGIRYEYKLVNTYDVKKTGTVSIYRNPNKTTLALVTCTWGSKTKQTVFISELISKTKI